MAEAERTWHDLQHVLAEVPDLEMGQLNWMTWDAGSALLLRIGIWARNCCRPRIDHRFSGPTEIRCQRVTDWVLRPVSTGWLHGGPRMVFHHTPEPEVLATIGSRGSTQSRSPTRTRTSIRRCDWACWFWSAASYLPSGSKSPRWCGQTPNPLYGLPSKEGASPTVAD
jgi:hypothetical protein